MGVITDSNFSSILISNKGWNLTGQLFRLWTQLTSFLDWDNDDSSMKVDILTLV